MKKYDLCVKTGSYTDKQGNEKISWENIGVLMEGNNGNPFILMKPYFNPAGIAREEGRDNIIISYRIMKKTTFIFHFEVFYALYIC